MHSSRAAFSSLQTQQGLGLFAASTGLPAGLFEAARLLIWRESEAGGLGVLVCILGLRMGMGSDCGWQEDVLAAGADIVAVCVVLVAVYAR